MNRHPVAAGVTRRISAVTCKSASLPRRLRCQRDRSVAGQSRPRHVLESPLDTGRLTFLEFSPDSQLFVSTYLTERGIHILEARTGHYLGQLAGHLDTTVHVAFSPDGKTLASAGGDGALKLWHLPTRREVATMLESGAVGPVAFSPDGSMLIAGVPDEHG